jgi:hypothetical protein
MAWLFQIDNNTSILYPNRYGHSKTKDTLTRGLGDELRKGAL